MRALSEAERPMVESERERESLCVGVCVRERVSESVGVSK